MRLVATFFALTVLALSQPLMAHTKAVASTPADGAAITAPTEISLEFPAPVKMTAMKLENEAGDEMALGPLPEDAATAFSIAVSDKLAPGRYLVTWRSISGDSHIVSGEIRFSVTA